MASRHTKKGKNPGPVDEWLDGIGFYRKNIAYDETCLFRAVSEQMYACQLFHEKIRLDCIKYGRNHFSEFKHIISDRDEWNVYLDRLQKHMAICGKTEMYLISKTYKKGIMLFDGLNHTINDITQNVDFEPLLLCKMGEDHYDVVYKREYIQDSGFCQSIIYKMLYENVFKINKVDDIVQTMLYQKPVSVVNNLEALEDDNNNNKTKEKKVTIKMEFYDKDEYEFMLRTNIAPFPFKVAKALDPTIYRNIEYDSWTEMRKELRLGDWYYGDNNLIQGSACILKENGEEIQCYIQDILKNENKCVVYITSKAEKRIVKMNDLQPEVDAKPWPLPYRFTKNQFLTLPKIELPDKKSLKKRREKKRSMSKCSNESEAVENMEGIINAFAGPPLQMQSSNYEIDITEAKIEESPYTYTDSTANLNEIIVPSVSINPWDNNITQMPTTPEPMMWPLTPTTPQNIFTIPSPMVQRTPEIYSEPHYYYPAELSPHYNVWTNPPEQPLISPQVEMYPPIYTAPPGTSIIITPTEIPEFVMPTPPSHLVYSPSVEVPYIPISPFMYPPTPPHHAALYAAPYNSQGFIFPNIAEQGAPRNQ